MRADLDGDSDLDRGATGPSSDNWGGVNADVVTYNNIDGDGNAVLDTDGNQVQTLLKLYSTTTSVKFGLVNMVRNSTQTAGSVSAHGVTQIYMVGKVAESDWMENGVDNDNGTPTTGSKLTLYRTASAHNGSAATQTISPTQTGTLNMTSTSVGSMNHWLWKIKLDGSADAWQTLYGVDSATAQLTIAAFQGMAYTGSGDNGSGHPKYGMYDLELVTDWIDDGSFGVVLPTTI